MAPGYFPRHSLSVETGECSLSPTRARCPSLTRRGPVNHTSGYLRNVHAGLFGEDGELHFRAREQTRDLYSSDPGGVLGHAAAAHCRAWAALKAKERSTQ